MPRHRLLSLAHLIQAGRAICSGKKFGCLRMSNLAVLRSLLRLVRQRGTPCGKCVETFNFPSVKTKVGFGKVRS
jgi:hypothetical protein